MADPQSPPPNPTNTRPPPSNPTNPRPPPLTKLIPARMDKEIIIASRKSPAYLSISITTGRLSRDSASIACHRPRYLLKSSRTPISKSASYSITIAVSKLSSGPTLGVARCERSFQKSLALAIPIELTASRCHFFRS